MKLLKNFLNHFFLDIKLGWKKERRVVILSMITLIVFRISESKSQM